MKLSPFRPVLLLLLLVPLLLFVHFRFLSRRRGRMRFPDLSLLAQVQPTLRSGCGPGWCSCGPPWSPSSSWPCAAQARPDVPGSPYGGHHIILTIDIREACAPRTSSAKRLYVAKEVVKKFI